MVRLGFETGRPAPKQLLNQSFQSAMTDNQIFLIRSSWSVAVSKPDMLAETFYRRLFEIDSTAQRLFAAVDMETQHRKLVQSLAVLVQTLDDLDAMLPVLAALGKRHVGYGVEHRHFDSVGAALLTALDHTLGDAFTPDVFDAWNTVYTLVAGVMRRALLRAANEPSLGSPERSEGSLSS